MPNFKVHFANGHTETVEATDGSSAKLKAREKSGLAKDERGANGNPARVSLITRVESIQQ